MRSYRHHFHAGNHADVLKHWVLMLLLEHLGKKDKPFRVIDTHAGAGYYILNATDPQAEWRSGIQRLWAGSIRAPSLARLTERVAGLNGRGHLRIYPGSPAWAQLICRPNDEIRLFEWHPTDHRALVAHPLIQNDPRVRISSDDGLSGLKALLPPPSRRGLVIIDPPYENAAEYHRVKEALILGLNRFPTGIYALWYPKLAKQNANILTAALEQLQLSWLHIHLQVKRPQPDGWGMTGSGMFVVNPPWTLGETLASELDELVRLLGVPGEARWHLRHPDGVA